MDTISQLAQMSINNHHLPKRPHRDPKAFCHAIHVEIESTLP